mgnify:CR=1 FL=1
MPQPGVRANFSPVVQKPLGYKPADVSTNPPRLFTSIDNSDSPYQASDGQYLTVDMSAGDVSVKVPASGFFSVSRDGALNTLTLTGTISGTVNPTINFDKSTATMAYTTEWRYV